MGPPRAALGSAAALLAAAAIGACGTPPLGYSAPPPLPMGVVAQPEERWYAVSGSSPVELLHSLRENGPQSSGRRVWGLYEWNLRWRYRYAEARGTCNITDARVELTSVTTMPRWVDRDSADPELVADWDTMIAALQTHENGHRDFAYTAAREVLRELKRVTTPTCAMMRASANERAHRILRHYRELNRRYDEETRSGGTQGVVWPPARQQSVPG